MERNNTLYEWCLLNKIKPLDITDVDAYMLEEISLEKFKEYLSTGDYDRDSTPRKPEKFLELRMYGLVPYNLSPIQQGIQYGHALQEYNNENFVSVEDGGMFHRWSTEHKTFILLNGGTSNEGHKVRQGFKDVMYIGSMQNHLADLKANGIRVSTFYEPDLNSMLTAVLFVVDERVFNKKDYPNFVPIPFEGETDKELIEWSKKNEETYRNWVDKIGGPKNEFLRDFLVGKKLA